MPKLSGGYSKAANYLRGAGGWRGEDRAQRGADERASLDH
jgi:hypothetical protein